MTLGWRREIAVVVICSFVVAGCWVAALTAAIDPVPPVVLLYAEPGVGDDTVPVRAVATWPARPKLLPLRGEVAAGAEPVSLLHGVAHVKISAAACPPCDLELVGDVGPTRVSVVGSLAKASAPDRSLLFLPWTSELLHRTVLDLQKPPLYPVEGRARPSGETPLLLVEGGGVVRQQVTGTAASARAVDGRALKLDRTGVRLEAPATVAPGASFSLIVTADEPQTLYVDLFVDERWRRALVHDAALGRSEVELRLPDDARRWFAVHAPASPLGETRGAQVVGLVGEVDAASLWPWTATTDVLPKTSDPLLRLAQAGEVGGDDVTRALMSRLRVNDTSRRRVGASARAQQEIAIAQRHAQARRWQLPFRGGGVVLALLLARLALLGSRRPRVVDLDPLDADAIRHTRGPLAAVVWGTVALMASLAILWVLDWALGFVLLGLEAS